MVIRVTPVRGPTISPISPATLNSVATTVGVTPSEARIGSIIGAITAFPPPKVPSRPQIRMEQITNASLPFVGVLTPMRLTIQYTRVWVTPVSVISTPSPAPVIMMTPIRAVVEPRDAENALASAPRS